MVVQRWPCSHISTSRFRSGARPACRPVDGAHLCDASPGVTAGGARLLRGVITSVASAPCTAGEAPPALDWTQVVELGWPGWRCARAQLTSRKVGAAKTTASRPGCRTGSGMVPARLHHTGDLPIEVAAGMEAQVQGAGAVHRTRAPTHEGFRWAWELDTWAGRPGRLRRAR